MRPLDAGAFLFAFLVRCPARVGFVHQLDNVLIPVQHRAVVLPSVREGAARALSFFCAYSCAYLSVSSSSRFFTRFAICRLRHASTSMFPARFRFRFCFPIPVQTSPMDRAWSARIAPTDRRQTKIRRPERNSGCTDIHVSRVRARCSVRHCHRTSLLTCVPGSSLLPTSVSGLLMGFPTMTGFRPSGIFRRGYGLHRSQHRSCTAVPRRGASLRVALSSFFTAP